MSEKKEYDDRTKQLYEIRKDAETQFDKLVVYLAAGGLVVSISLVKDIIGEYTSPINKWSLVLSWILFTCSLIVNLISFISARFAVDQAILSQQAKNDRLFNTKINFDKVTRILNWSALFFLLLGLVFLVIFSISNI